VRALATVDEFIGSAIKVEILKGANSDARDLAFTWDFKSFEDNKLSLSIDFDRPSAISMNADRDFVSVLFRFHDFFFDNYGQPVKEDTSLLMELPPQMSPRSNEVMQAAKQAVSATTTFIFSSNIVMNVFLAASLNQLWSMINSQQIMVLFPLFKINLPANTAVMFNMLMTIAAFDIVPTDAFYEKIGFTYDT